MRAIVVIPARGGSKGIPNKNLRPLAGKPLIGWTIEVALAAPRVDVVVVSTDDDAIAGTALRFGARVLARGEGLGADHVTLDPVVADAIEQLEAREEEFDLVLTLQPTSPLLTVPTLERIIARFESEPELDSLLTAVDDTHLAWIRQGGRFAPAYERRLNRQQLPPRFKETGGVLATRRRFVTRDGRLGANVDLHVVSAAEGCDIDTADDWLFVEAALARKRIAFIVIGSRRRGLGHVTRAMSLMECMTGHVVQAFCDPAESLAVALLSSRFFPHTVVSRSSLYEELERFGPDIIIHDQLDTRAEDLAKGRELGARLVCFEDLGAGLSGADLVFNELYPEDETDRAGGHYFGAEACVLRDEFIHAPRRAFSDRVGTVLITFGGTDPSRLTFTVLEIIGDECPADIVVVAGKGVDYVVELEALCTTLDRPERRVEMHHDVRLMSDLMSRADLAFCSAGRTLYELAQMRVPAIVLAQNELELKHTFGGPEYGFMPLGLGSQLPREALTSAWRLLLHSTATRRAMWDRMNALDLTASRDRVVRAILDLSSRREGRPTRPV